MKYFIPEEYGVKLCLLLSSQCLLCWAKFFTAICAPRLACYFLSAIQVESTSRSSCCSLPGPVPCSACANKDSGLVSLTLPNASVFQARWLRCQNPALLTLLCISSLSYKISRSYFFMLNKGTFHCFKKRNPFILPV